MKRPSLHASLGILASLSVLIAMAVSTNSCSSSTTPTPAAVDTIHLVSIPNDIMFPALDSIEVVKTLLTCGCPFKIKVDTSGGDMSAFTFEVTPTDTGTFSPHVIEILVDSAAATPHHLNSAWIAYSAVNHFGKTDYDTLRFSVNIP